MQADFSLLLMGKIRILVYNAHPASGKHRQMDATLKMRYIIRLQFSTLTHNYI